MNDFIQSKSERNHFLRRRTRNSPCVDLHNTSLTVRGEALKPKEQKSKCVFEIRTYQFPNKLNKEV